MIKVELTNVSNGIVKKIIDTQFNSGDQLGEITTLYEIDEAWSDVDKFTKISELLYDITKDLALDIGSKFSQDKLNFNIDWGSHFEPNVNGVQIRIKNLQSEIRRWKSYKNNL